jgi:hypothetical protein
MTDFKKYFAHAIRKNFPDNFAQVISRTEDHYQEISKDTSFAAISKNPLDRRLDFSSYFLAFIMTLDAIGESFEDIRNVCLEIVTSYVQPRNKLQAFFKRQLPKLLGTWVGQRLVLSLNKKVSQNKNPEGFVAAIITDKQKTFGLGYGVDILECGICKIFNKHNFGKYASILCEVDEITSSLAGLKLIRTGTIATGAKKCDFRYQRID